MKKELVKVGMKVKFAQDIFLGLKEQTPLLENEFTIAEVTDDGCVLSATIKGNTCNLQNIFNCADFEPYEEPKEKLYAVGRMSEDMIPRVEHITAEEFKRLFPTRPLPEQYTYLLKD